MRCFAVEPHAHLPRRFSDAQRRAKVPHTVGHDAGIEALPCSILRHDPFAAAGLLGWGAHHYKRAGKAVGFHDRLDGDRRGYGGCGNQVVPAGVAHAGESVVFGIEADGSAALLDRETGLEGGLQAVDMAPNGPSPAFEPVGEQLTRFELLEDELRVVEDLLKRAWSGLGIGHIT